MTDATDLMNKITASSNGEASAKGTECIYSIHKGVCATLFFPDHSVMSITISLNRSSQGELDVEIDTTKNNDAHAIKLLISNIRKETPFSHYCIDDHLKFYHQKTTN